ncbi:unnamed protein product [Darwinula stevensoni]|uniref:Uncharacterized protein n=1 Tax=Darwinula stevensoni TaxID=69355 RepID=A0A7R9A5I6_9CRUS|nr:unnamed protein product [Darwinula stevensoni]CAG0894452.1 unnamed protein product [Darwinula stevensoni]
MKRVRIIVKERSWDVGFPDLLCHILSYEIPHDLRVKPGTLNTMPKPSSVVFGLVEPSKLCPKRLFVAIGPRGKWRLYISDDLLMTQ